MCSSEISIVMVPFLLYSPSPEGLPHFILNLVYFLILTILKKQNNFLTLDFVLILLNGFQINQLPHKNTQRKCFLAPKTGIATVESELRPFWIRFVC